MSVMGDDSLLQDFIAEGTEHLSSIEPDLLELESSGNAAGQEVINRVFRAIHSIKGAAGFFGFQSLQRLSHVMESLLMQVRDGERVITPELMDALLAGVDALAAMFADLESSENVPCAGIIADCEALLGQDGGSAAADNAPSNTETSGDLPVSEEMLNQCKAHGQRLYRLVINMDNATAGIPAALELLPVELDSMGSVLASQPPLDALTGASGTLEVLYATVLEPELLELGLPCPAQLAPVSSPSGPGGEQATAAQTPAAISDAAPKTANGQPLTTPAAASGNESIRVRVNILERLMNLAGELVLSRNQLNQALSGHPQAQRDLHSVMQGFNFITSSLQENIMQTRLQPLSTVFSKLPRLVRDLSRKLDKQLEIEFSGGDVELDKTIVESLSDPLTHIIRNSCDHGIEPAAERESTGKPPAGHIWVNAYHESGHVNIVISDNGRGIDAGPIVEKAVAAGIISAAAAGKLSKQEQLKLIFAPGLSTAKEVSDVSGRGVGMDVVRNNIERLGGHISLDSEPGEGTTIQLRLPLTLAIIACLSVRAGRQRFAIPQVNLEEMVWLRPTDTQNRIELVDRTPVLRLRGHSLPVVRLGDALSLPAEYYDEVDQCWKPDQRVLGDRRQAGESEAAFAQRRERLDRRQHWQSDLNIVIMRSGEGRFGLVVDELFEVEEVVVKPLSQFVTSAGCYSGATIMGDGSVSLILDSTGLAKAARLDFSGMQEPAAKVARQPVAAAARQHLLLFTGHPHEYFALPLRSVARLDEITPADIARVGQAEYANLFGKPRQLVRLDQLLPVSPLPSDLEELFLITPRQQQPACSILAGRILDAVETSSENWQDAGPQPGIAGQLYVDGKLVNVLDLEQLALPALEACDA